MKTSADALSRTSAKALDARERRIVTATMKKENQENIYGFDLYESASPAHRPPSARPCFIENNFEHFFRLAAGEMPVHADGEMTVPFKFR